MAKVTNNLLIRGLSGKLGDQFIVKTSKSGRTVVSAIKDLDEEREFSQKQLIQQQAFREAIAYAKAKKGEEIYIRKANGGPNSPYNLAVADWFNHPEILEVDTSDWHGAAGDVIRLRVQDDVKVNQVTVTINDASGDVLESGPAVDKDALWWEYKTTRAASGSLTLAIAASDLPGHVTEYSQKRTFS